MMLDQMLALRLIDVSDDADVAKLLKLFTELPLAEIDRLAALNAL